MSMKLRQPSEERNKEFFLMVQTLFNQETYIVGSNLLNYYDHTQIDDLNKCEKFRAKTARMNMEGQSCFLDLIDTQQNQLAGCVGCIKVNRIDKEAALALIFYQQYFDFIGEAIKCFFEIIRSPKYNLRSLVCNASGYHLGAEAVEVLQQLGFTDVTGERPRTDQNPLWMRYTDPTAPPSEPPTRRDRSVSSIDGDERWSTHTSSRQGPGSIPEVCRYWIRGQCKFGADCRFLHEAPESPSLPSTRPSSPGPPAASTAPTAGPAGSQVFLYPQMVYALPVTGTGEYDSPFAVPSQTPAAQQEVSFASYSTVSQDMTEFRDFNLSGQVPGGVGVSTVPSLDSAAWDAQRASEFVQQYATGGEVPARRTRSEDTVATTRMYEKSAALAQRARTEVAELLDLINTAHPQWLFHLRFSPQFVVASPIVASSRAEERRGHASPSSSARGQSGVKAQGQASLETPDTASPATAPRRLTSADLQALNRYYETAEPLSEMYRRVCWPPGHSSDGHASTDSTATDEYALESVHTATTDDFTAHSPPPSLSLREQRAPSQPTRERREQLFREATEMQRTRFLIHCLQLDPQGSSEQMMRRAQPVLREVHSAQETRGAGGAVSKTRRGEQETGEVPVPASDTSPLAPTKAGPRYFTQEMVGALLAFRQRRGMISSIPAFLGVVRLATSASSAESMISLNRAVAESYAHAKAEVIKQQQYFVALQQQYLQQQLQLQSQQIALQEQQEQFQRDTEGRDLHQQQHHQQQLQEYQTLEHQHQPQEREQPPQQQQHLPQYGQQAAAQPRHGIIGGPQPSQSVPGPASVIFPVTQVAPSMTMPLSQTTGIPQATQQGVGAYPSASVAQSVPAAMVPTAGGYLPAVFPAAYQYGQPVPAAVPVPVQVSPRALLVNAQQRTPFMQRGRSASASTPMEPQSAIYRQVVPVQSGVAGPYVQAVMGTSTQRMQYYTPQLSMQDTATAPASAAEGKADAGEGGGYGEEAREPGAQQGGGNTGGGRGAQRRAGRRRHGGGGAGQAGQAV